MRNFICEATGENCDRRGCKQGLCLVEFEQRRRSEQDKRIDVVPIYAARLGMTVAELRERVETAMKQTENK
jgi:hypothetical protein